MEFDDRAPVDSLTSENARGVKRRHSQMASANSSARRGPSPYAIEPIIEPHDSWQAHSATGARILLPPLEPRIRTFPFDPSNTSPLPRRSVDLRRPARTTMTTTPEVIDLTDNIENQIQGTDLLRNGNGRSNSQRTARASDRPPPRSQQRESSSDLMVTGERQAIRNVGRQIIHDLTTEAGPIQHPHVDLVGSDNIGDDDDDDVIFTGIQPLPGVNNAPPAAPNNRAPQTAPAAADAPAFGYGSVPDILRGLGQQAFQHLLGYIRADSRTLPPIEDARRPRVFAPRTNRSLFQSRPMRMIYDEPAFDLGLDAHLFAQPAPERQAPPYTAPEEPQPGFTRSPAEDEELICPACGHELATGDTEDRRQVWVIKGCGHVYCGKCMKNRNKSAKRGKGRAVPPEEESSSPKFAKCMVTGCDKKIANKSAVLQIFL